ncbi:MAG: adenylyltransferase/cytidyltransferase family protein [bacterium]
MLYKTGLIIGRFQPFHKGHLYLIREALKKIDKLIIGIGSSNINNEKNPFSYKEREKYIKTALKKYKLLDKIIKIVPLEDYPDNNDYWLQELKKKTGNFNVAVSNNDWVIGILKERDIKTISFSFYKRDIYEGVKIRKELKKSKNSAQILKKYLT